MKYNKIYSYPFKLVVKYYIKSILSKQTSGLWENKVSTKVSCFTFILKWFKLFYKWHKCITRYKCRELYRTIVVDSKMCTLCIHSMFYLQPTLYAWRTFKANKQTRANICTDENEQQKCLKRFRLIY